MSDEPTTATADAPQPQTGIAWGDAIAAREAIIGLLIEISFIATFTQRFFGS